MAKYRDLPQDVQVSEPEVLSELLEEPKPAGSAFEVAGKIMGGIIAYTVMLMAFLTIVALWYRFVFLWIIMP